MKKIAAALLASAAVSTVALAANPFQLVGLAYNGYLKSEGIPSFGALCNGRTPSVDAHDVIAAGVARGYVTAEQATSARYERGVEIQLWGICSNR